MALSERVLIRSFAGATEWLNSEPLGPAGLEGSGVTFVEPGAEAYAFDFG